MEEYRRLIKPTAGFLAVVLCFPAFCWAGARTARWGETLTEIEALILDRQYEQAVLKVADLEEDMLGHIVDGPRVEETLAKVAALYALALAGTGESHHAAWKWHMAMVFHPPYREFQLGTQGPAGIELARALAESQRSEERAGSKQELIVEPRMIKKEHPRFPQSQRYGRPVLVAIEVVIGKDGVPRDPRITNSSHKPILVYLTLDALRQWRFSPAEDEHGPIAVVYPLTVKFKRH